MLIWLDGKILPEEQALIPVLDRGLMLGDGLFETLRCREFRPDFWADHYGRLSSGAARARIPFPWSATELSAHIEALCRANGADDATVRLTLTRGSYKGSLAIDPTQAPRMVITAVQVRHLPPELYSQGIKLWVASVVKGSPGSDAGLKQTAYLQHVLAKAEADDHNCYEALLRDREGRILESSTASFFGVLNGVVRTAPLSMGILPGITRAKVLEAAAEEGIPVSETELRLSDLPLLTEAFITSSVRGVVPACWLGGWDQPPSGTDLPLPGSIATRIMARYSMLKDKIHS